MSSKDNTVAAAEYWGYLIKPDKTPSPLFEQLLLGVARYIIRHIAPWDTHYLTPTKLATFYRLVGGDYDPLFLDTSQSSLSFIYQSLGCFHTLQPEKDPFRPPTIPALTPQGFVRWQTVQLLLEPDEHVPFLQEAVKRFELTNPTDGEQFPSLLPREALPMKPDPQMIAWHDTVSEKLMIEAQASQMRNMPPRPQMALSDADPAEHTRPSSGDTYSSIEPFSMVGAAKYFSNPSTSQKACHSPPTKSTINSPTKARGMSNHQNPYPPPPYDAPWSPLRRRSSMPPDKRPQYHHPPSWHHFTQAAHPPRHPPRPLNGHARTPSTLSSSSFTSDSSYTTSSASPSPVLHSTPLHPPGIQYGSDIRRSQSLGYFQHHPSSAPPPPPTAQSPYPTTRRPSLGPSQPSRYSGEWTGLVNGSAKPNERGLNVRWPDQDINGGGGSNSNSNNNNNSYPTRLDRSATVRAPGPDKHARTARSADGRRSERERERQRRGQSVGVRDGRRDV